VDLKWNSFFRNSNEIPLSSLGISPSYSGAWTIKSLLESIEFLRNQLPKIN
jgi:hypothetical protein